VGEGVGGRGTTRTGVSNSKSSRTTF